jgi:tRNA A37 N6-isopentenylltransferase MiaA
MGDQVIKESEIQM